MSKKEIVSGMIGHYVSENYDNEEYIFIKNSKFSMIRKTK